MAAPKRKKSKMLNKLKNIFKLKKNKLFLFKTNKKIIKNLYF